MAYSPAQLIARIQQATASAGLNPAVAVAQARRESGFKDAVVYGPATGGDGERGVFQFMPATWARFGNGPHTNAYDPDKSITAYVNYMSYLLRLFNGDYAKALTGYNGGEGHVLDPRKYGPPTKQALNYAREVLAQAGSVASFSPPIGEEADSPEEESAPLSWLPWAVGVGLVAWIVLDD